MQFLFFVVPLQNIMVQKKKQQVVAVSEESSDSSVSEVRNAFAALNDESSSEEESSSSENESSSSEEESSEEESLEDSSSEGGSSETESSSSSDESSSSDSSGFFSDASSELNVSRWVTVEDSSEDEGPISKEKKDKAHIIRERWLKKKDEIRTDEFDADDSGEEFSGRLRWMKTDYRERFLREHGLGDLIKSKDTGKKKKERKDLGHKKKEVKFNEVVKEKKGDVLTVDNVMHHFYELLDPKNRVATDFLSNLQEMLQVAPKNSQKLKILLTLVNAKFDYAGALPVANTEEDTNIVNISFSFFKEARDHIDEIFTILEHNPDIIVHEMYEPIPDEVVENDANYESETKIKGSIVGIVERIDEEFVKLLSLIEQSDISTYQMIYSDEYNVISLLFRAMHIYKKQQAVIKSQENQGTVRLAMRLVDKLYYRPNAANVGIFQILSKELKIKLPDPISFIVAQVKFLITEQPDQKVAAQSCLFLIYHLALNDDFKNSHFYFTHFYYSLSDVVTSVLYNRTLCQVALCAFRLGKYEVTCELLKSIYLANNIKELLGQTSDAFTNADIQNDEFESTEKKRALPWHLHIPDEVIDSALLLSMMIMELPMLAIHYRTETPDTLFKELYFDFVKNVHHNPPETSKDYVFLVAQCLIQGKWEEALEIAGTLPIWGFIGDECQMLLIR